MEPTAAEMAPEEHISKLLARIAQLETDKVELQKATVTAKEVARNSHLRYKDANSALVDYTLSYDKRLDEKQNLMDVNTEMEKAQLALNKQIAESARQVSDMTIKDAEMKKKNGELQSRVEQLEREKAALQRRVDELEAVRREMSAAQDGGRTRRFFGGRESYTLRRDNERGGYQAPRNVRGRTGRSCPVHDDRFDPSRQPLTGPKNERR